MVGQAGNLQQGVGRKPGGLQHNKGRGGDGAPQVSVICRGAGWGRRTEGAGAALEGGLEVKDGKDGAFIVRSELDGDEAVLASAGAAQGVGKGRA